MSTVLGIDQSFTSTGWCLVDKNEVTHFGVIKSDGTDSIYARAEYIAMELVALIKKHKPDVVRMEQLAFAMVGNASKDLSGLLFVCVVSIKRECGIEVEFVAPTQVKKFATGGGGSNKTMMLESLPERIRKKFVDNGFKKTTGLTDLCDAFFIAMYKPDTYFR